MTFSDDEVRFIKWAGLVTGLDAGVLLGVFFHPYVALAHAVIMTFLLLVVIVSENV